MSPGSRRRGIAKFLNLLSGEGSPPQSGRLCSLLEGKVVLSNSITESSDTLPTPLIKLGDLKDSQHALWNMDVHRKANRLNPISDMTKGLPGHSESMDPEVLDAHMSSLSNLTRRC